MLNVSHVQCKARQHTKTNVVQPQKGTKYVKRSKSLVKPDSLCCSRCGRAQAVEHSRRVQPGRRDRVRVGGEPKSRREFASASCDPEEETRVLCICLNLEQKGIASEMRVVVVVHSEQTFACNVFFGILMVL